MKTGDIPCEWGMEVVTFGGIQKFTPHCRCGWHSDGRLYTYGEAMTLVGIHLEERNGKEPIPDHWKLTVEEWDKRQAEGWA